MQPIELTTPMALSGLLLLIPIIILYLIKPKPKHIRFPSVMFILRVEKSKRFRSFFRRFIRDPLLIIQLIIIILLVLAIAEPFFFAPEEKNVAENSVLIIDASASMQSTDIAPSRFSRAKDIAGDLIDKMNENSEVSIVIAENVPIVLSRNQGVADARYSLDNALVSDSPTNIGDALVFSRDMLSGPKVDKGINKKIYVLSDFSGGEGTDLRLAQRMATRQNISVDLIKINGGGDNIAIIDINARRFVTDRYKFYLTFTVRNFYNRDMEVTSEIRMDNQSLTHITKNIPANSEKLFNYEGSVSENSHSITVRLGDEKTGSNRDFLSADDIALAFLPRVKKHRVLLITDDENDVYLKYALESSRDVELEISIPPVIPKSSEFNKFDAVILGELDREFILEGMFRDLGLYADNGGHVIFLASSELCNFEDGNLHEIIPVELDLLREGEGKIHVQLDHEIMTDVKLPDVTKRHIECRQKNESVVIATVSDSPAIAYHRYGRGKVAFIGINPNANWSSFYHSSSFPIFWLQLIKWITRDESTLAINNFGAGDYLPAVEGGEITTPSGGRLKATNLILDEIGFYDVNYGDRTDRITVSLVNKRESDIAGSIDVETAGDEDFRVVKEVIDVRKDVFPYILALVILFFFVEVFYYRRRGMI